jgi:hypothetical protein
MSGTAGRVRAVPARTTCCSGWCGATERNDDAPRREHTECPIRHPDLQLLHFLAQLPPPVRRAAHRARKEHRPCLLCGGRFYTLGIFVPHDPPQWGITPGMQGACVYALCKRCGALPDRAEGVLWEHRSTDLQRARALWN